MKISPIIRLLSWVLIGIGLVVLVINYVPAIYTETNYLINPIKSNDLIPVDTKLGIVIPKVGANASIVPNVDPNISQIYQHALTKGVAHAQGTVLPGDLGTSFLFSHSSASLIQAKTYNSVFFLLAKLESGDSIIIYRDGLPLNFKVVSKQKVSPDKIEYLHQSSDEPRLILMTCWPPGTDIKRLLIFAKLDTK